MFCFADFFDIANRIFCGLIVFPDAETDRFPVDSVEGGKPLIEGILGNSVLIADLKGKKLPFFDQVADGPSGNLQALGDFFGGVNSVQLHIQQ